MVGAHDRTPITLPRSQIWCHPAQPISLSKSLSLSRRPSIAFPATRNRPSVFPIASTTESTSWHLSLNPTLLPLHKTRLWLQHRPQYPTHTPRTRMTTAAWLQIHRSQSSLCLLQWKVISVGCPHHRHCATHSPTARKPIEGMTRARYHTGIRCPTLQRSLLLRALLPGNRTITSSLRLAAVRLAAATAVSDVLCSERCSRASHPDAGSSSAPHA